jgi:MoaA/NifB/PqqE/SkfB family radical SAM enzyme
MKYSNYTKIIKTAMKYPAITRSMIYRQNLYKFYSSRLFNRGKVYTRPTELVVLISRKCFLNCVMCGTKAMYGSDERFSDYFELKYIKKIADEIAEWKSPIYVKLTGGEAMMHPQFEEIIDYFKYRKIPIRLSTNGVLLRKMEKAKTLVDAKTEVITISVDGTEQDHNRIRQKGAQGSRLYSFILEGVDNLSLLKKEKKSQYPMVQFTCTVNEMNYRNLYDFVDGLKNIDIQWLHLAYLQFISEENGKKSEQVIKEIGGYGDEKWKFFHYAPLSVMNMDLDMLAGQMKKIYSSSFPFPISASDVGGFDRDSLHRFFHTDDQIHNSLCANTYISAVILSPGLMTYCIDFPQFDYGDIRERTIEENWFSDKAQSLRKKFRDYYYSHGDTNMPHCLRCGWRFW